MLRFGMVALEFVPGIKRIVGNGIPDFSRFVLSEIVREDLETDNISVIEITMDTEHIIPNALSPRAITELAELKDELGHSYTVHLPLYSVEPSSFNRYIRGASVEAIVHSIRLAQELEPEAFVLHSTGALAAEFSRLPLPPELRLILAAYINAFAEESLEDILAKTEINPRKLAVENIEFPFEVTRDLVDKFDTGICLDTGHVLSRQSGDESLMEFYRKHRDRIVEIHIHDGSYPEGGRPFRTEHTALGRGEMPIREFLLELMKDEYDGPLIFELAPDEVVESLAKIQDVVPEALGN
ncbi:MAG: sugar phosphate isomerase/epimerase [Candidatus Thorarchaeota archaeon]|nr:sugar phosphate isomerase/epimerase [Candidatus Thorarchaeota archaeon]